MIRAALSGRVDHAARTRHPIFNLEAPNGCPIVFADIVNPVHTWTDRDAAERQAHRIAAMVNEDFRKFQSPFAPALTAAGRAL
jgi:phosphoenolpyruvate carboxykinase (ATP)